MAVTTPILVGAGSFPIERYAFWAYNNTSLLADDPVMVKVAPGVNKAIYLTHITISLGWPETITLKDTEGTVLFGPIGTQEHGSCTFSKDWKNPMKLKDNTGLVILQDGDVGFTFYAEGFTATFPIV